MMLQGAGGNSGDAADSAPPHDTSSSAAAAEFGSGGFSEDERGRVEDGGRSSGGNRWPRQETLALLKIRSDMDVAFRDSSLKGPLWDEVSRKLAELGYHRSAKKCKEKFENVYKYHKRTKEGRTSKADGKTYRFFDQLQALEGSPSSAGSHHHHHHQPPPSLPPPPVVSKPPQVLSPMPNNSIIPSVAPGVTPIGLAVSASHPDPISVAAPAVAMPTMSINHVGGFPFSQLNMSASTNSSGSESSSEEDEPPERRRSRKRKWKEFFGRLMKEVVDKQEEMQLKFLDTLERRERDRMAREETWRLQEMAKMKREHELLVQERSMVAAKDAAVISFLQKITEQNPNTVIPQISAMQLLQQQQQQQQQNHPSVTVSAPAPTPVSSAPPPPPPQLTPSLQVVPIAAPATTPVPVSVPVPAPSPAQTIKNLDNGGGGGGGGENLLQPSPSRWPKAEINALIHLRTTLDTKYQESGPKGPLWEEISSAMRKIGYNRNAKRCKEKWENINKYYKKVKESSKKRPEDSKTCPYFHQLDAIYREKANSSTSTNTNTNTNTNPPGFVLKPEAQMAPIMARPEQQWPLPGMVQEQQHQQQQQQHQQQNQEPKSNEPRGVQDPENDDDYDDDEDEEDDEEEEGGDYEIVPNNKTSSMAGVE